MLTRRSFIQALTAVFTPVAGSAPSGCIKNSETNSQLRPGFSPLSSPDVNGVMLASGYRSRIVARSGLSPFAGSTYRWHDAPDGGACFTTGDGGWIYVSNSEVGNKQGGAGAIRFDTSGMTIQKSQVPHFLWMENPFILARNGEQSVVRVEVLRLR